MIKIRTLLVLTTGLILSILSAQDMDKTKLSIYGFVRAEMFMDQGSISVGDWPLFVPKPAGENDGNVFSATARHSRIGLKILNSEVSNITVTGLIEFDFAGGFPNSTTAARQPIIRMRHAWVDLKRNDLSLRIGQDWAIISSPFPTTGSFTVGAGLGNIWMRFSQAALRYDLEPVKFAVSLNRPMSGNIKYDGYARGDFDPIDDGETTGAPWIMGRSWLMTPIGSISVSGHYGKEDINDLSGSVHRMSTWSVNSSAIISAGPVKLTARAFTGENLNSFFGGIFQGFTSDSISVMNISSTGGWGQVTYPLNKVLTVNTGYGIDDPDDTDLVGNSRSKNQWIFANISYALTSNVKFLFEIDRITTNYLDGSEPQSTRIHFSTQLSF